MTRKDTEPHFAIGLGRAFAGALIFSLPMLMTMEMWHIGIYLDSWRLILFLLATLPVLIGLSHFGGFESTGSLWHDAEDALVALAVAAVASAIVLAIVSVISDGMTAREVVGKVAIQLVPASIGALLARSQLGGKSVDEEEEGEAGSSYFGELFLMLVGALFLSLNVAPTEEVVLLAHKMNLWHELVLVFVSLIAMHALVYSVQFRGGHARVPRRSSFFSVFARFTVAGYALVLITSLAVLWVLGRTDGNSMEATLSAALVLAFPGAIGAAAARLVL